MTKIYHTESGPFLFPLFGVFPMSGAPAPSGSGRFAAFGLGMLAFLCIAMLGGTGYMKYRLDLAETALATAPSSSQANPIDRLSRDLGYGGFLGLAQKRGVSSDTFALTEMKDRLKSAHETATHLPAEIPVETKNEIVNIAALFEAALQKIEANGSVMPAQEFAASDLAPLYAALPILDGYKDSFSLSDPSKPLSEAKLWSMLLAFASWLSLIIGASSIGGMYLVAKDRRSVPLKALAQSVENMARGDMRTAIWGLERQDSIGDLARAIDSARYRFSQLPDVALMSDEGPVHLRFEGETRSLFDAMMKALSADAENIREQSASLTSSVQGQKESIAELGSKVEEILSDLAQRGKNGDKQLTGAIKEMVSSTENLKNAHTHAADQLARLIPAIQDRAQGLAEITQITGKQLTHTLQSLASSEISLKSNAEQTKETLSKLSSTADDLGERLFGAINLLQASGKVLGETTEAIKAEWSEIASAQEWNQKFEDIATQLVGLQAKLDAQADSQFGLAHALEQSMEQSNPDSLRESILAPLGDSFANVLERLSVIHDRLNEQSEQIEKATAQQSETAEPANMASIEARLAELADLDGRVAVFVSALPGDLRQTVREEIQGLSEQNHPAELQEKLSELQASLASFPDLSQQLSEIGDLLTSRFEEQRSSFDDRLNEVKEKLSEFEGALAAAQHMAEETREGMAQTETLRDIPQEIHKQFLDQWFQVSAQIEATRTSLAETLSVQIQEIESRLTNPPPSVQTKSAADYALKLQIEKQTEILSELVGTLGLIDAHMNQITTKIQVA